MAEIDVDTDKSARLNFLEKRDLERKLDAQRRKDDKVSSGAQNEKMDFFEKFFSKNVTEIETILDKVDEISPSDLPDYFNNISKQILNLQKFVAASNIFLKGYHIQKCQNIIQALTVRAKELEDKLIPKKKFGFKSKKRLASTNLSTNMYNKHEVDSRSERTKEDTNTCQYLNRNGALIVMNPAEVYKKDITVQNLQNCCVKICGSPSTLHINDLKNCYLLCGPVSTSIFTENCENSVFVIACQQLRLHNSKNITIYLHVTSRAIMEDCSNISIAPYNWQYDGIEKDFEICGLDMTRNNWKCVDDFNWLNIQKPSPNWKALNESDYKRDWNDVILQYN